jgi:hypothetical protein
LHHLGLQPLFPPFADTHSKVIHPAARRPRTSPQPPVNNFAGTVHRLDALGFEGEGAQSEGSNTQQQRQHD